MIKERTDEHDLETSAGDHSVNGNGDAIPGGEMLRRDPFLPGRLRMRERENSIYAASTSLFRNEQPAPQAANFVDKALPEEILEEKRQARIGRLSREAEIFSGLMNTCTSVTIPDGEAALAAPCVANSDHIDDHLSQFVFFVLQNGPTARKEESDLFTTRDGVDSRIGGFYLSPERAESLSKAVNEFGESRWIHIREKKIDEAPTPIFPRKRVDKGAGKTGQNEGHGDGPQKGPRGLNLFMLRLARIICIVLGAALVYVLLSGKDILPKLF